MAGLPDSDHCAVGLDLIDVTTFHPDILRRIHRRRNDRRGDDWRGNDRGSGDDRRSGDDSRDGSRNNPVGDHAAYDAANEARPEIPAAATPCAAVAMAMMHRTRNMMMADGTAMAASRPAMPSCERRSRAKRGRDTDCCDFYRFIHIAPSLSPRLAVTVGVGEPSREI